MALYNAFCEWVRLCDSGRCTEQVQQELHAAANRWPNPANAEYVRQSGWPQEEMGRRLWLEVEITFKGVREEKLRRLENAHGDHLPTDRVEKNFNSFLRKRLNWELGARIKARGQIAATDQTADDDFMWAPAALQTWLEDRPDDPALIQEISERLQMVNAHETVSQWLSKGRRGTLFFVCEQIKLNDARFSQQNWRDIDLPGNQGERYAVMHHFKADLAKELHSIARASLATTFIRTEDVDVFEAQIGAQILLQHFFTQRATFLPENTRQVFLQILGNQPLNA
jgi:hypothetical protein